MFEELCVDGIWDGQGDCLDPDECVDDDERSGDTPCGPNGRGTLVQICSEGLWQDTSLCQGAGVCVDAALQLGSDACGINGRGLLSQLCVAGAWKDTTECVDPDECLDGSRQAGSTACGNNDRGRLDQECVQGRFEDTTDCQDPDVCVDEETQPTEISCGLNDRGVFLARCELGNWQSTSFCDDPDVCVDGSEQSGSTACGPRNRGRLTQQCEVGAWADTAECVFSPNILLIIADDVGTESSSLYPDAVGDLGAANMPHLEELAQEGLVFENAWANPVCSPTRSTIVTGLYGNRTGVLTPGNRLDPDTPSLFDHIASGSRLDYGLSLFGKWHLAGSGSEPLHVAAMGLETFWGLSGGGIEDYFKWTARSLPNQSESITQYSTTAITNRAIDYIDARTIERPQDPWFMTVAYNAAHFPFQVPPKEFHSEDVGDLSPGDEVESVPVYHAMLEAMDSEVGRLLEHVDRGETVVIYLGDNGTPKEVKDPSSPVRDSKISVYQGGVWVPLLVAGVGVMRRGEREEALVGAVDLFATIATLAGVPTEHLFDSESFAPLLVDGNASTGRTHLFAEHCSTYFGHHYAIRDERYKLLYERPSLMQPGSFEMYDLQSDPGELLDIYEDEAFQDERLLLEAALDDISKGATTGCFL